MNQAFLKNNVIFWQLKGSIGKAQSVNGRVPGLSLMSGFSEPKAGCCGLRVKSLFSKK